MRNKKIGTWIARLLITMLTVLGLGQTMVHAEEVEGPLTDVIITKVETKDNVKDMTLAELENGVNFTEWFSEGSKPLQGVSFTYYSVNDQQLADLRDGTITAANLTGGISTAETGEFGKVTIPNLPEGNYWIVENPKGTIVDSKAVPFFLILPFTNQTGDGFLGTIHVYPKNTLTTSVPDIEKTIDESNVAIGDENIWTVTLDIPVGIEDYDKFSFYDNIDSRLDYLEIVSVMADGSIIDSADYDVSYVEPKLNVDFNETGRANLKGIDKVKVKIKTKVNKTAIMGQEIPNNVTLEFNNGHGVDKEKTPEEIPSVHTGGKAFIKLDGKSEETLKGAEFKIQNAQGQLVDVATDGTVTFGGNGTVFTSDVNGKFEIKGLPYGEYVLVETKAPEGYALPTNPNTDFTVSATSYYEYPDRVESYEQPSVKVQYVMNRKMTIPQTGGMGTVLFTVVGAVMMLFSALFYKRTKEA